MTPDKVKAIADEINRKARAPLFLESGFLNFEYIWTIDCPFIFIIGGRGTGKTYGGLLSIHERIKGTEDQFIYLRRSRAQLSDIVTSEFNPFNNINRQTGSNVIVAPATKTFDGFFEAEVQDDGTLVPHGAPIGYAVSISTAQNSRGLDRPQIKYILFDEFIKLDSEKAIKGEASAFFYTYETVNRNRELEGLPPVRCFFCANSNKIDNPLFDELELVAVVEKMRRKRNPIYIDKARGLAIIDLPADGPIAMAKRQTALYKLAAGTEYARMALENSYNYDDSDIASRNLSDFLPLVKVGELCIYKHKNDRTYYCTTYQRGGFPNTYTTTEKDLRRFVQLFYYLIDAYTRHQVVFESYTCESMFRRFLC